VTVFVPVTPEAREYLLREGTDLKYGARHLKRAIERHIVYPLANLLATEQVRLGDMLCIDWDLSEERLVFHKEGEGAVLPVATLQPRQPGIQVARASGGRAAELPSANIPREGQQPPVILPGSPSPAPANRRKNENET